MSVKILVTQNSVKAQVIEQRGITVTMKAVGPQGATGNVNSHIHDDRYYTEAESDALLAAKADDPHTHGQDDIISLVSDLAGKLAVALNLSDVADVPTSQTNLGLGTEDDVTHQSVTVDKLALDLLAAVTVSQGEFAWNADEETVDLGLNGAVLQLGQEVHYHVRNNSGADIANGKPIMATGTLGASGRITIGLMDATDHGNEMYFLGIATEDIQNDTDGKVSNFGKVRGIDTTGASSFGGLETWNDGDILYLDPDNVGYLTKVSPEAPAVSMPCAIVIKSHSNGTLFVRAHNVDENHYTPLSVHTLTGDPTGWVDNTAISLSYDSTARTITLTGDLRYYWKGILKELTSPWTSDAHAATADTTFFLYSTDGDTFAWNTTVWDFDQLMVAFAWYGTLNKYGVREVHGTMPWQSHREFHARQGTYKVSGGTLSGYVLSSTTAADRRPTVSATVLNDEDIYSTLSEWNVDTLGATQFSLAGAGPTSTITTGAADIVPLSGSRPYWNEFTGGAWQQTLISNNQYMAAWLVGVPTTSDAGSQSYRYWWVQGQTEGDLATIQARSTLDLELAGIPTITPEFTFLAKAIIQYQGGDWQITQVDILSGSRSQITSGASGNYLSIISSDSSLLGTGTSGDPLYVARSVTLPVMDGTAAVGIADESSRSDHVHPTDTSREPANVNIQAHISSTSNPHSVTYTQVGAEPANANIQAHVTDVTTNPHSVTYSQVGAEQADATILKEADVSSVPANAATTTPISSDWAYDHENDAGVHDADQVTVDATGFSGNLSVTDTDVQTALATLDAMVAGGGGLTWAKITGNTNATDGNGYAMVAAAALTVTLPATPTEGDTIGIVDANQTATTYTLTVARNGSNIESTAEDLIVDIDGAGFILVYVDSTIGWKIVTEIGANDPPASFRGALIGKSVSVGNTSVPNASWTACNFDVEIYDTDGFYDSGTDNTKLVVPDGVSRVQLVASAIIGNSSSAGQRYVSIRRNGGDYYGYAIEKFDLSATNVDEIVSITSAVLEVTPGQYFQLMQYQTSGITESAGFKYSANTWMSIAVIE